MEPLAECCQTEAERSLAKHRKVATCDRCARLVLGDREEIDYERTIEELVANDIEFQVGVARKVRVIAYRR